MATRKPPGELFYDPADLDASAPRLHIRRDHGTWELRDAKFYTGKVLNSLLRGLPSQQPGRIASIDRGEQQRLVRDVLIARSAKRVNAAVVTCNAGDFRKIRRFCNVRVVAPADFLEP